MGNKRRMYGIRKGILFGLVACMILPSAGFADRTLGDKSVKTIAADINQNSEQEEATRTYINENINAQNYTYPFHTEIIGSYLEPVEQGYMRVQKYNIADILIEYYDEEYGYLSTQTIQAELPIFGGFYAGSEYYYVVWGKNNLKEYDNEEVIRVVKYTKNWERISQCSVYGANTTKPFNLGILRMIECNGYLFVRTTHEMYKISDEKNHQANMTLQIRIEDMVLTDSAYDISAIHGGYVSHCFNTFILTDDTNHIITLDQGDGAPRGAMIGRYTKVPGEYCLSGRFRPLITFSYQGESGKNTTRATLGGFSYSDSNILVAGTSIGEKDDFSTCTIQNLYLSITERKELEDNSWDEESKTTKIRWLTDFKYDGKDFHHCATTPRLVKWENNLFLLIWSETEYDDATGKLYYEFIDGEGNCIGERYSTKGNISDCQPVIKDNKVVWYTTDNKKLCFYSIDKAGTLSKKTVTYPKQMDIFPKPIKECRLAITRIGGFKKNQVNSSYVFTFRGKPLVLDKDYYIRGEGYRWCGEDNSIYSFSKAMVGCDLDFYGTYDFEVEPIRKNPKLISVKGTSSQVTIKWEKETGCMGYEIYRSIDGKRKKKVAVIDDSTIGSWKDKGIKKGHYYSYSIRAYTRKNTETLYTNYTDSITILPNKPKLFENTKIKSVKRNGDKVTIKVSKNKAAMGYDYQFSHSQEFDKIVRKKQSSNNNITLTIKDIVYFVRVRVYRTINGKKVYGPWSKYYYFV